MGKEMNAIFGAQTILIWTYGYMYIYLGKRKEPASSAVDEDSTVIQAFRKYQQELDGRHDKYERIVKLSRDVTVESKRAIFMLHRASG